jgi:Tetratricopeptide repeat
VVVSPLLVRAQPAPANAADPRAAEAKQRYENGMAHFNLEEWDAAIDEWKSGYRAKPVAQFLYNIAQAYRLSKHYDEALSFYQRYLRADPKAPNRVEVEGHIAKLTSLLAQEKKTQNAPPTATLAVKPKGSEGTPVTENPNASPAPEVAQVTQPSPAPSTPPPAVVATTVETEKPQPITKKKWFLPVVIVAGVVVVGAIVVGAAVGATSGGGGDNTKVLGVARF